jgi:hypothetical protein
MLISLNAGYHLLHMAVVAINLFGWMSRKSRVPTLILQGVTFCCWIGFGLAKGWWGYCPLTDWHWQLKSNMGEAVLPNSYITYIFSNWFMLPINDEFATGLIVGAMALSVMANVYLMVCAWQGKKFRSLYLHKLCQNSSSKSKFVF